MEGGSWPGQVSVSGSADLPGLPCQGTKALRRQCRLGLPTKQPCILPANLGTYELLKVPADSRVKNQALEAFLSLTAPGLWGEVALGPSRGVDCQRL